MPHGLGLLRMLLVMACMAKTDQIIIHKDQLRVLIRMLDVVYLSGLSDPAIPPALPALVVVAAQDLPA